MFTRDDLWKLNTVEARPDAPAPSIHELFETSTSRSGTCTRMGDYFFQDVKKDPYFSDDSEWIYFLVSGTCNRTASETPTNRDDYEVLRMNRNLSGMVENVTQIFHGSDWSNHDTAHFAVSGAGDKVIFDGQRPTNALSKSLWLRIRKPANMIAVEVQSDEALMARRAVNLFTMSALTSRFVTAMSDFILSSLAGNCSGHHVVTDGL